MLSLIANYLCPKTHLITIKDCDIEVFYDYLDTELITPETFKKCYEVIDVTLNRDMVWDENGLSADEYQLTFPNPGNIHLSSENYNIDLDVSTDKSGRKVVGTYSNTRKWTIKNGKVASLIIVDGPYTYEYTNIKGWSTLKITEGGSVLSKQTTRNSRE